MKSYELKRYVCGQCHKQHVDKFAAEKCCKSLVKNTCSVCGCSIDERWFREKCSKCLNIERAIKSEIVEIPEYWKLDSKVLYYEGGGYGESFREPGYFDDLDDLLSYLQEESELDEYGFAFICGSQPFYFDPEDFLYNLCEDLYEDAFYDLDDKEEFIDFANKWKSKQTVKGYYPSKKIIVYNQELFDFYIASGKEFSHIDKRLGLENYHKRRILKDQDLYAEAMGPSGLQFIGEWEL